MISPLDPCGCIVDAARVCGIYDVKYFRDADTLHPARWYRTPPGAKPLGVPTVFTHPNWTMGNDIGEPRPGQAGFVHKMKRYDKGKAPPLVIGDGRFCGKPRAFAEGANTGLDPILDWSCVDFSECCLAKHKIKHVCAGGVGTAQLLLSNNLFLRGVGTANNDDGCVASVEELNYHFTPNAFKLRLEDVAGTSGIAGDYILRRDHTGDDEYGVPDVRLLGITSLTFFQDALFAPHHWFMLVDAGRWGVVIQRVPTCDVETVRWEPFIVTLLGDAPPAVLLRMIITPPEFIGGGGIGGGGLVTLPSIGGGGVGSGGVESLEFIGGGGVGSGGVEDVSFIGGGGVGGTEGMWMPVTTRSLRFDGATVHVGVPDAPAFKPTTALSLSVWINTLQTTLGRIITTPVDPAGTQKTGYSLLIGYPTAGHVTLFGDNGMNVTLTSPSPVNDGTWHHIAATWDGSNAHLYVDGTDVASTSVTGTISYDSSDLMIGRYKAASQYYAGLMDEPAVFASALFAIHVAGLASGSIAIPLLSPVAYWPFEEGGDSTVHDRSGNGNDGTISVVSVWALDHPAI